MKKIGYYLSLSLFWDAIIDVYTAINRQSQEKIASLYEDCNIQIKEYLNISTSWDEIAFFGGSFTCIDSSDRKILYSLASENGFRNIRISTRPDCIDEEIVEEL